MLKLNTAETAEGRWIDYAEGVAFKVRPLTGKILRDLRKQASTSSMAPDARTGKYVPTLTLDDDKFDQIVSDYVLEDFKGVGDSTGKALEVTLENKKLILDQIPLRDFIWNAAQSLDIEAEQIKN